MIDGIVERVAEHIHQDHDLPLGDGQMHERAQGGARGDRVVGGGAGILHRGELLVAAVIARAAAQQVERGVVGDAK